MIKYLKVCPLLLISIMLFACSSTEIDKNPTPIVWGGVSFFPTTVEKSGNRTVYNNMRFSGYGKSGVIDRVVVEGDEIIVENIQSPFYSAKRQVWKNVTGQYQEALQYILSDKYEEIMEAGGNLAELPKVNAGYYAGTDEKWVNRGSSGAWASSQVKNLSFSGLENGEYADIQITAENGMTLTARSLAVRKLLLPEELSKPEALDFEKLTLEGLVISDLAVSPMNLKSGSFKLDYSDKQLQFDLDNASMPGLILAELGLQNPPERLEGSLKGKGNVSGGQIDFSATIDINKLLDASVDLKGNMQKDVPDSINFSIKDLGLINYMSNEAKARLAMLALFLPNGQEALFGFLAKPGQTLAGEISFMGRYPIMKFNIN